MNFGQKLRLFRKRHALSQSELGAALNVDQTTISGWEHSAQPPRDWYIYADALAEAFNIPLSQVPQEEPDQVEQAAVQMLEYGSAEPRGEEATPVTARPGAETYQQMIRRHFPTATPEQFAEIQRQVEAFMEHNIQEMRAINRIGDTILDLAKQREGQGGESEEDGEATKHKPFRPEPEEFHGDRVIRAN